jgi:hypothetical protein
MDGGADGSGRREGTLIELSEKIGQALELTPGSGIASRVVTSLLQVTISSTTRSRLPRYDRLVNALYVVLRSVNSTV